jgi:hypothetical protein
VLGVWLAIGLIFLAVFSKAVDPLKIVAATVFTIPLPIVALWALSSFVLNCPPG